MIGSADHPPHPRTHLLRLALVPDELRFLREREAEVDRGQTFAQQLFLHRIAVGVRDVCE